MSRITERYQEGSVQKKSLSGSIKLPFVGTRGEDRTCFQYIPLEIGVESITFALPQWVVSRERLHIHDLVNLHIPFETNNIFYREGSVTSSGWDDALNAQVCEAVMERSSPPPYPVRISFESCSIDMDLSDFPVKEDLLLSILKDSIMLKKGVTIYLKHLIPYFSRISLYPEKKYRELKEQVLYDIRDKALEHKDRLTGIHGMLKGHMNALSDIPRLLDLEELRSLMESEISLDLFSITFPGRAIGLYLHAIKELEDRLYFNYNTIVMLFIRAL